MKIYLSLIQKKVQCSIHIPQFQFPRNSVSNKKDLDPRFVAYVYEHRDKIAEFNRSVS